MGGFEEYSQQKEDVGYSDRAEERDGAAVNEESEQDTTSAKLELQSMRESGGLDKVKDLCSMDMSDTLSTINQFIYKVKNGYLLNLNSHYQYIIDHLKTEYTDHLEKNSTRYDELIEKENIYFNEKFNEKLYNELLSDREAHINEMKNLNDNKQFNTLVENIKKGIYTNEQYNNQEIILHKQIKQENERKDEILSSIDESSNLKDVETSKLNNKYTAYLQQIGIYVYFVYIIYLCIFISFLLITDLKTTITSFSRIFLIIMLCILPDYIYPPVYFSVIVPFFDYIYNNNFITKPLPPNVYDDISLKEYLKNDNTYIKGGI